MSDNIQIEFIPKADILIIMPLLTKLNQNVKHEVLRKRILEMNEQNYECIGIYLNDDLVGICGLWFQTRHYSGRSIELDHVMIDESIQSKGIGKKLIDWIYDYAKKEGYEAVELNTYVSNPRSHKFYYNMGFEIKGYHFVNFDLPNK